MRSNIKRDCAVYAACSAVVMLICLFVVSRAFASAPSDQVSSETVKFQDLNLGASAGVSALYQRIHAAAQRVCSEHSVRSLANVYREKTCTDEAVARAVKQVNVPALTAYSEMKAGHTAPMLVAKSAK
jgi:UrcA family protein